MTRTRTNDLPGRLSAVYAFIVAYKMAHDGNAPTMREIAMEVVKKPTTSLASFYVEHLVTAGKVVRIDGEICIPGATWTPPGDNR